MPLDLFHYGQHEIDAGGGWGGVGEEQVGELGLEGCVVGEEGEEGGEVGWVGGGGVLVLC